MTEPCSTISMVIRLYEITNSTVSTGRRLYFFFGFFGVVTAIISVFVFPNKVVKWHPGLKAGISPIAACQPMAGVDGRYLINWT